MSQFDKMHLQNMRRAIELSRLNVTQSRGGPFGAVVVYKGEIVGEGTNLVTYNNDPTAHAEVCAIRAACQKLGTFNLSGASIYTSCEPCPMCLAAIYWARVDKVFYANTREDAAKILFDDALIYDEISRPIDDRKIIFSQLLRDEAIKSFELWDKSESKVKY